MRYVLERVQRMLAELDHYRYRESRLISPIAMKKTREKQNLTSLDVSEWQQYEAGQIWGGHWEYYWFAMELEIPPCYEGKTAELEIITGKEEPRRRGEEWGWDATNPQFSAYVNGKLVQGLDINHRDLLLTSYARAGERFSVVLSAFTGDQNFQLQLKAVLKIRDEATEKYFFDLEAPFKIAEILEREDTLYLDMVRIMNQSLDLLDLRKPYSDSYYQSLECADRFLEEEYYRKYENQSISQAWCVGHTHIDVAWKWTLDVTKDKAVRSFSTVLELMERYPEYRFMSSQPQLYLYLKKYAPKQYERLRARVKESRWEPEGGMFLEADVVLTSGESLVRQLLYGKRFFRDEFGIDSKILWMPDVFGYTAALPQIMAKSGIKYFMTTKIGWNETNCFPYDTFMWEGLDGSEILTHMSPARSFLPSWADDHLDRNYTTYNAYLAPSHMMGGWQRYRQKDISRQFLAAFGFGDGGGGPTREELESYRRLKRGLAGCPKVTIASAGEFFESLEEEVGKNPLLPRWVGELYMEFHRGVYTSMGRNKKYNRKSEFLLQAAESLSCMAGMTKEGDYPSEALSECWEILMRNQFHDILPGSSVAEVYEDSRKEYIRLTQLASGAELAAAKYMADRADIPEGSMVVFNPSGVEGEFLLEVPVKAGNHVETVWEKQEDMPEAVRKEIIDEKEDAERTKSVFQQRLDADRALIQASIPSKGYQIFLVKAGEEAELQTANFRTIDGFYEYENRWFTVTINSKGQFTRLYDKEAKREILLEGQNGKRLVCYEDIPCRYDCWNIDQFYEEKSWVVSEVQSAELIENGSLRSILRITYAYLESEIQEDLILYKNQKRLDMKYRIDWKQHQLLLKSLFPLDIHTNEAVYEVQFGNITRPTHRNTSWDHARFEVWTQKWMDLSEDGYGVSFLNDCKYGVSVNRTTVGLTLLKSGIFPNSSADQEVHEFTFSLYPHEGGWRAGRTVQEAILFNTVPAVVCKEGLSGASDRENSNTFKNRWSLAESLQDNVILDTVKRSEDKKAVILRLYECHNKRTKAVIRYGKKIEKAILCDLQEQELEPLTIWEDKILVDMKPYEIVTIKVFEEMEHEEFLHCQK